MRQEFKGQDAMTSFQFTHSHFRSFSHTFARCVSLFACFEVGWLLISRLRTSGSVAASQQMRMPKSSPLGLLVITVLVRGIGLDESIH